MLDVSLGDLAPNNHKIQTDKNDACHAAQRESQQRYFHYLGIQHQELIENHLFKLYLAVQHDDCTILSLFLLVL